MSSVGVTRTPDWAKQDNFNRTIEDSCLASYGSRFLESFLRDSNFTPFDGYRSYGAKLAKAAIKSGMRRRLDEGVLNPTQIEDLTTYVYQMMVRKKSSEQMLSKIVRPFVYMPNPLEDHLPGIKDVPMAFMYGEYDWVNRDVADRLIDSGKV